MLEEILWFFSLPVFIYITYRVVLVAMKKFEKKLAFEESPGKHQSDAKKQDKD